MLTAGKALKVAIYFSGGSTHHAVATCSGILDFLFYRVMSGATAAKGIPGFGADHHMPTSRSKEIPDRLPLKIEFIESREKVNELLGKLGSPFESNYRRSLSIRRGFGHVPQSCSRRYVFELGAGWH